MKAVESAIHKSNLPGLTPQKTGANSLKLPVPRSVLSDFSLCAEYVLINGTDQRATLARH